MDKNSNGKNGDEFISLRAIEEKKRLKDMELKEQRKLLDKKELIRQARDHIMKNFGSTNFLFTQDQEKLEELRYQVKTFLRSHERVLAESQINEFTELMVVDIKGIGPLEQFRLDNTVKEIKVNTFKKIYIYKTTGEKVLTDVKFDTEEDLIHVVNKIADYNNKSFGYNFPRLQAVLPGQMRVHAVHNSLSDNGTTMNIRKFPKRLNLEDLINFGSLTPEVAWFLSLIPATRKTFAACGPTGSGKTTLGMALFDYAPRDLAIVSIEDTRELVLLQEDWRALTTREPNSEGEGAVTISDLFADCMRMTPDCIIVGEVRKPRDAYEMLQAFHTGHKGSFITIHASSAMNFATRLSTLLIDSGRDISLYSAKEMIGTAFDYIVFQERELVNIRARKEKQFVKGIAEIRGFDYDKGEVLLFEIFKWKNYGIDFLGNKKGRLEPTGEMPLKLFAASEEYGVDFNEEKFRKIFLDNIKPMDLSNIPK